MTCPFNKESLAQLKSFVSLCQNRPELLHAADLSFFREYIESLGAKIPSKPTQFGDQHVPEPRPPTPEPNDDDEDEILESDPESDVELNLDGCVEPDALDDSQIMGDEEKEPTEEDCDKADEMKREAASAMNDGDNAKAIGLFTQAIELNPKLAILFTKRGQAYLRLNKPNACIKDCTHALELNCDSAPAFKFRGRAFRLIGKWEEAAKDLRQACKIDFDEQADEWLKEVQPNAIKIEQHKVKQERRIADKQEKEMSDRIKKAREAHAKASKDEAKQHSGGGGPGGFPDLFSLWQDPEILAALQDPEVAAAFKDISTNPANMMKYENNPKVQALIANLAHKFDGSGGGMPGFSPMGGGGMGSAPPGASNTPFTPSDDGLD